MAWSVQAPASGAKSFIIDGPLPLEIDYDDVSHADVLLLAEQVAKKLNQSWSAPTMYRCEDPDCWTPSRVAGPCLTCGGPTEYIVVTGA